MQVGPKVDPIMTRIWISQLRTLDFLYAWEVPSCCILRCSIPTIPIKLWPEGHKQQAWGHHKARSSSAACLSFAGSETKPENCVGWSSVKNVMLLATTGKAGLSHTENRLFLFLLLAPIGALVALMCHYWSDNNGNPLFEIFTQPTPQGQNSCSKLIPHDHW